MKFHKITKRAGEFEILKFKTGMKKKEGETSKI